MIFSRSVFYGTTPIGMAMTVRGNPAVLVVDDDPQVLDLFGQFLEDEYAVHAASSGGEALEQLSASIDVVLLDRRMPDMSGDEVLERIRDRGYDCRVAMITAVRPDVDVVDMAFDDYVVKPVTSSKLKNTIDSLLAWDEYDEIAREYFAVAEKLEILEAEYPRSALEEREEYRALREELRSLRSQADGAATDLVPTTLSTISEGSDRSDPVLKESLEFSSDQ